MATHMRDDELGAWTEVNMDGTHVEWRRRPARAQDALHGTDQVVDISLDGGAPVTQADFDANVPEDQQLELRVNLLK